MHTASSLWRQHFIFEKLLNSLGQILHQERGLICVLLGIMNWEFLSKALKNFWKHDKGGQDHQYFSDYKYTHIHVYIWYNICSTKTENQCLEQYNHCLVGDFKIK